MFHFWTFADSTSTLFRNNHPEWLGWTMRDIQVTAAKGGYLNLLPRAHVTIVPRNGRGWLRSGRNGRGEGVRPRTKAENKRQECVCGRRAIVVKCPFFFPYCACLAIHFELRTNETKYEIIVFSIKALWVHKQGSTSDNIDWVSEASAFGPFD